ncbi:mediator complex subunit 13 C-terminal-domain-containing protein [Radiomyces spectabilis]|uniref:mediator complex subunit 13 C-terminal-domain-containing protein n=1 Tax=Radiomyces spectabilis TaxID=64574 RepID=UPI00221F85C0|nr:mediator complex subunit 13 C-terminal-domain-containing protein [Radiomyces spectabilis]KAI8381278.1 mediator complex subunit 13 C-terminal-domain-containing protein [Radiomyces spectabilis]
MLTDSSLTNILIVSGVSQIRYRVYSQLCKRSLVVEFLKCEGQAESDTQPVYRRELTFSPTNNILIKAFRNLIEMSIPCMWRVTPKPATEGDKPDTPGESEPQGDDLIPLELWVFWFDERHTGKIDSDQYLNTLEEIKVGSFTWENVYSKSLSPTASPLTSSTQSNSRKLVTLAEEYKLFIKSARNLVQRHIVRKGAFPLGEFFIFPSTYSESDVSRTNYNIPGGALADMSNPSLLCCTYNLYLTSTNLIFQPDVRRMRMKPLTAQDIKTRGTQVVLSPTGEKAQLMLIRREISPSIQEQVLRQWSLLYNIPLKFLIQNMDHSGASFPSVVAVRSSNHHFILYPTALIFIPVSANAVPISAAGMNGIFGYNHGQIENLGEKWSRWAWSQRVKDAAKWNGIGPPLSHESRELPSTQQPLDFWDFTNPKYRTASTVLETLSVSDASQTQGALQKAIHEPVISSPLMASKAVALPSTSSVRKEAIKDTYDHMDTVEKSELSLMDFALTHFDIDPKQVMDGYIYAKNANGEAETVYGASNTFPLAGVNNNAAVASPTGKSNMQTPFATSVEGSGSLPGSTGNEVGSESMNKGDYAAQQSTVGTEPEFDLGIGMDNVMMDMPSTRWTDDGMADLDNFDFDVTEEDFNFFESESSTKALPTKPPSTVQSSQPPPPPPPPQQQPQAALETAASFANAPVASQHDDHGIMLLDNMPIQNLNDDALNVKPEDLNFDQLLNPSDAVLDTAMDVDTAVKVEPVNVDSMMADTEMHEAVTLDSNNVTPNGDNSVTGPVIKREYHELKAVKGGDHRQWPEIIEYPMEQRYVPPEFAPVAFTAGVNDAKYCIGGKFMYMPPETESQSRRRKSSRDTYRPDYIPVVKKRSQKKRKQNKDIVSSVKPVSRKEASAPKYNEDTRAADIQNLHAPVSEDNSSTSGSSSSSSSSEGGSSSSDESYTSDEEDYAEKYLETLEQVQSSFVNQLLGDHQIEPKKSTANQLLLDYEHPFPGTVASAPSSPICLNNSADEGDFKALDYLCQQAVLGGYPFTDGLASISASGGELSEGESAKIIVSRRRDLIQSLHGDTSHVPSLQSDFDRITQDFKHALLEIFDQHHKTTLSASMDTLSIGHASLPGSVSVKGPLNVQQYYDLAETNQAHSKYGKYQVKKRRPAEPNLDTLYPPDIVVSRQDHFIEGSPKLLTFWEKLRLEPFSSKKNISYFVVFPRNDELEKATLHFFKGLSTVYETCNLGVHHPGNIGAYRRGLVPVPLLPESKGESWHDRQLRSYMAECQNLGSALGETMAENMHIVIYIVNPSSHLSSNLDLSRCFQKLMVAYHAAAMGLATRVTERTRARLVLQLMPMEHIIRPSAFGGCLKFGLKEIVFSVYCKCHLVVGRHHNQSTVDDTRAVADIYAPPFVLTKSIPSVIQFSLKKPLNSFPAIMEQHATLHVGYCFSLDLRWMIIVWTDNRGELLEFTVLAMDNPAEKGVQYNAAFEEAWWRSKEMARRTGAPWTFVIAKIGLMFEEELQAWIDVLPSEEKATIVSLDLESSLNVQVSSAEQETTPEFAQTPGSSATTGTPESIGTPTGNGPLSSLGGASSRTSTDATPVGQGETRTLLLNHRVAYSRKREKASQGILATDAVTETERWMLPLATGYLIHTPTEPSPQDQFNGSPLVVEVHLLFNQTDHSAYSTLRDIIKQYHALSYVNVMPSRSNCLPIHQVLVERLCRLLLIVNA